jgi:hypothetical protein
MFSPTVDHTSEQVIRMQATKSSAVDVFDSRYSGLPTGIGGSQADHWPIPTAATLAA